MASFKAHISFGVATAVALSIAVIALAWTPVPLVFIMTIVGSMLPDIDSDTGKPVKILFSVFSVIFTFFTLSHYYRDTMNLPQ